MKQYLELYKNILERGTYKPAARENMPGTISLFGYQFRHDLADGFPALTTKKLFWKGVVVELLWFLKGNTNVKYLIDNGVNFWNEDAYNYYTKKLKEFSEYDLPEEIINFNEELQEYQNYTFDEFVQLIKEGKLYKFNGYTLGDCGYQYGKVFRNWGGSADVLTISRDNLTNEDIQKFRDEWSKAMQNTSKSPIIINNDLNPTFISKRVDQIQNLIDSLRNTPESRRHILTAIDPGHQEELALFWCHCLIQLNCRPLSFEERYDLFMEDYLLPHFEKPPHEFQDNTDLEKYQQKHFDNCSIPKYYLDLMMTQRSGDSFLGISINIASYALLLSILAKMVNMIPGDFIHSFGDVHIYENHLEQMQLQSTREPYPLPTLKLSDEINWGVKDIDEIISQIEEKGWENIISLENYKYHAAIKGELSTGLKK